MKSLITAATVNIPFVDRSFADKRHFIAGAGINLAGASVLLAEILRFAGLSI